MENKEHYTSRDRELRQQLFLKLLFTVSGVYLGLSLTLILKNIKSITLYHDIIY